MRTSFKALAGAVVLSVALSSVGAAQWRTDAGFNTNTLARNDDGSTPNLGQVFGHALNFFGVSYDNLWLNNNGNITFSGAMGTFTPFNIVTTGVPMIAPFFADVDTRDSYNGTSAILSYGRSGSTWGANWDGVCFYGANCYSKNAFQLVLVDRPETGLGNFDFEFNYKYVNWETGQASSGNEHGLGGACARVGYSNGSTNAIELLGSGLCGRLLDGGSNSLVGHTNVGVNGTYRWSARNGTVIPSDDVVPEPFSIILLGTGLAGIGAARRRRNKEVA